MASGSEHLRPNLHAYLVAHSTPPDALLRDLIAETAERFPDRVVFQIGPEQGTFMTMLAGILGARSPATRRFAWPAAWPTAGSCSAAT